MSRGGSKMSSTVPPESKLPDHYDDLVAVAKLTHGKYNPRRVSPSTDLRESIKRDGIERSLIVRRDDKDSLYHITDGWQRYQAATDSGWEQLPVVVYDSALDALSATETASIVREWSTYDWARYCQSIATEVETDQSDHQIACQVAEHTTKSAYTVRRYLNALSLPSVVHPLLYDGPEGTETDWKALQNHNPDIRQYKGLPWVVAGKLGQLTRTNEIPTNRIIATAANAVVYDQSDALSFVEFAIENPEIPIQTVHKRIQQMHRYGAHLQLPRVTMDIDSEKKEAIMDYCRTERQPLSSVVEDQIRQLAVELVE